jgi:hypothetical protein
MLNSCLQLNNIKRDEENVPNWLDSFDWPGNSGPVAMSPKVARDIWHDLFTWLVIFKLFLNKKKSYNIL